MDVKLNIEEILEAHRKWRYNKEGGSRADLCGADLCGANLRRADLHDANLRGADLCGANLRRADLHDANLRGADLCGANLCGADLCGADLCGANLRRADLHDANLRGADLCGANLCGADLRGIISLWSTVGNKSRIKSLQIETYDITYTKDMMQIGCKLYPIEKWFKFPDKIIEKMDGGALEWWHKWRDVIKEIIEKSPAE